MSAEKGSRLLAPPKRKKRKDSCRGKEKGESFKG